MLQSTDRQAAAQSGHNIRELRGRHGMFFSTGATKPLAYRLEALRKLKAGLERYEPALMDAFLQDMGKSAADAYATEFTPILMEIGHALRRLKSWMKPRRVPMAVSVPGSSGRIYREPYGTVLIIAPWNYPLNLALAPLVGALAAGNTAIIKPSEMTPSVSRVLAELIGELYPPDYVAVVEGGVEASTALLEEKFDYIFFTGGPGVGRIVMEAAAKQLTPVTLELGGKSPCIVAPDANLKLAAKRIVWGKLINAGQTCIAPDYLYVHKSVKDELLAYMQAYAREWYGEDMLSHERCQRIVNARQYHRLIGYLREGRIVYGGSCNEAELRIEFTIVDQVNWTMPIMTDEIFGPILPVLEYGDLSEVIAGVNRQPKPLACYVFTASESVQRQIIEQIPFGGGTVNDTIMHFTSPYLPFGGVGNSGMGSYHGKASFDLFTHHKSVLKQSDRYDLPFRYMDKPSALKRLRQIVKYFS